jgi:periplasmic protein TonB
MSTATFSIYASLGVHIATFVLALVFGRFTSSVPHYHLKQGSPIVLQGSFAVAEPTAISFQLTLPPAADHGESLSPMTSELTAAAMDIRPVRTSIESAVVEIKLPAAIEDCQCESPDHAIQTPKRAVDAPPKFVSSIQPTSELRKRELTNVPPPVSTDVTLPPSSGNGGADVDVMPRKLAANLPPPYPPEAYQRGEQGRLILEVHVSAGGTVESLRVVESSGFDSLDKAALESIRQWRFEPGYRGGIPVEAVVNVPVRFAIR